MTTGFGVLRKAFLTACKALDHSRIRTWRAAYLRRRSKATFIAVTGSSGKFTTTALISHIPATSCHRTVAERAGAADPPIRRDGTLGIDGKRSGRLRLDDWVIPKHRRLRERRGLKLQCSS